jgi:hypothetical protein
MANLNKTECGCQGLYNASIGGCDPIPTGVNPCPSVWESVANWNWDAISTAGLEWGYGLGLLNRPDNTDTAFYMMELERQRRQTQYIMIGLIAFAIVIAIVLVRGRGQRK